MGHAENAAKMLRRKGRLQRIVLNTVAASGVIAVGALAPNAIQLLKFLPANKNNFGYRARTVAGRLVEQGLLKREKRGEHYYLRITEKGRAQLERAQKKMHSPSLRKKRWDRRWRMVMFDIPERRRNVRDRLRALMGEAGFQKFQDSVWVYPYDCEDFITLLKAELEIGKNIQYVIAEKIEHDRKLREHFRLPL